LQSHRRITLAIALAWLLGGAAQARAVDGPLLLFGGADQREFLGCLNCFRSEPFSVWNEKGEYGDPQSELSIWNRSGPYGSTTSPQSPWNPRGSTPPLVVDRVGNLYGYFTRNRSYPKRIRRNDAHQKSHDFLFLVHLLDEYEWIIEHLDDARSRY